MGRGAGVVDAQLVRKVLNTLRLNVRLESRTSHYSENTPIRNPMYAGSCGFASGGRGDWQERDDVLAFARR